MFKRTVILISASLALHAQAGDLDHYERMVVVGTKTENSIMDLPQQALVIEQEQIANSADTNLSELLANTSGIYVSPAGSTMSLRGMAHDDTLYLIDGKRVNGEYSKTYELERIPTSMIERIEILKGSSSLLYGSDALGGVVNIITKKDTEGKTGNVQLISGEYKKGLDAYFSYGNKTTNLSLFASHMDHDAFTNNESANITVMKSGTATSPSGLGSSSYWGNLSSALEDSYTVAYDHQYNQEVNSVGGRLDHKLSDDLKVNFNLSYMQEDRDGDYIAASYATNYINTGSGKSVMAKNVPAYQIDDNNRLDFSADISFQTTDALLLDYQVAYSKYDKDRKIYTPLWSELGYESEDASLTSETLQKQEYINHDALATYQFNDKNSLLTGVQHRREDFDATSYNVDNRNHSSIFFQHEYRQMEKLDIVYGARYDDSSDGDSNVSTNFGAIYSLFSNTKIKASYSEAFNTPEIRDLYVIQQTPSGAMNIGSTVIDEDVGKTTVWELNPEISQNYELAILNQGNGWGFDVTVFKTNVENLIEKNMVDSSYYSFFNVDDATFEGIDSSAHLEISDNLKVQLSYSLVDATDKSDDSDITDTPDAYGSLIVSYWLMDNLEVKSISQYTGKQTSSSDEELDSFIVTNVKAQLKGVVEGLDFFASLNNVFSEEVPDYLGRIPEASYTFGLNYQF